MKAGQDRPFARTIGHLSLALLLFVGASCNGTASTADGGGTGGATGGTGGHGTGGQGGIDNLCLSEGQGCGTLGPMCCSGLSCCYGSNGQASCVPGSCTGSQGGHGGGGAAGGGGGQGATGGAGGEGGGNACIPVGQPCSGTDRCCAPAVICAGTCMTGVSDRTPPQGQLTRHFSDGLPRGWLCHRGVEIHAEPNFGGACSMSIPQTRLLAFGCRLASGGVPVRVGLSICDPSHFLGSLRWTRCFRAEPPEPCDGAAAGWRVSSERNVLGQIGALGLLRRVGVTRDGRLFGAGVAESCRPGPPSGG
jgi:hypothetical protein